MKAARLRAGWLQVNVAFAVKVALRATATMWLCLQALGCFDVAAAATPKPLILSEQRDYYTAFGYIEYLEDKAGDLSFSEVGPGTGMPFVKVETPAADFGISKSAYWFRLSVTNTDPHQTQWWLEVGNTVLDWIEVYIIRSDKIDKHTLIRNGVAVSSKAIRVPSPVMRFDLHPGEATQIYLRLGSKGAVSAPIFISRPEFFVVNESQRRLWIGLCYGFVAALLLYNLILFLSTRDINYLYYCFCIGSYIVLQAAMDGLLYVHFWPNDGEPSYPKTHLIVAVSLISMLQFSRHFLYGSEVFPKLSKFMLVYAVLTMAVFGSSWVVAELHPIAFHIMSATVLGAFFIVILGAALALRHGVVEAKYFLLAWTCLLIGTISFQLMLYAKLPANFFTVRSVQLGSALEALLLSFALAHRMRTLMQENNRIQTEATIHLEHKAQQRTLELDRALAELAKVNRQLVAGNVKAVKADQAKSRFVAAASHDLRQPLQALGFYLHILYNRSPDTDEILVKCKAAFHALESLLKSLLDISKLDTNTVQANLQHIPINDIFKRLQNANDYAAQLKGLRLKFRGAHYTVFTDSQQLERILSNLIDNAVRCTSSGGILVCGRGRKHHLLLQVWDTGPGIPKAEHENIFREFYQIGSDAKNQSHGLGLGLAIVRRLTALLNIPVSLRSTVGKGVVFSLQIPYGRAAMALPPPTYQSNPNIENQHRLALVIDDDAAVRDSMTLLIKSWGGTVLATGSSSEALGIISEEKIVPDIIIADYALGGNETGVELAEALYALLGRDIPTIIITGEISDESVNAIRASGKTFIHKPIDPDRLKQIISDLIKPQQGIWTGQHTPFQ
ncbi:response regulator [Exilibacterium tricleocarpae]|uniref:histidine kinase n=1 Tax=Exilibacterium tricleocarpae TaxID=2591008 RepID=A0A545SYB5_9GAMM|nr:7TM diverse intracellular signaling domain-containing protein [Exilibacterium tricleocarpae]TQV69929.1 response regulator [Exilibacterium tricleocarpae]